MYKIGKVIYSQIHSLLPREAALVSILSDKVFSDYNEALNYCRNLRVSGDYTYVPVEIPDIPLKKKGMKRSTSSSG